jgi:hypothetical protein
MMTRNISPNTQINPRFIKNFPNQQIINQQKSTSQTPSCNQPTQTKIIIHRVFIFSSVRFLSKKITKPNFFKKKPKLVQTDWFRFGSVF